MEINVDIAPAFQPLWQPARYKGVWGGRGSGKSHDRALHAVIRALSEPTRIVCIREIQKSTRESIKALIEAKIKQAGVESHFDVLDQEIRGKNGSLFIFQGMQDHTADSIKSLEGYDIAIVEEAQTLSERSLRLLRPTIRKAGSELWFIWNPRHDTDPVDMFFRGKERHPDSIVVKANWNDNPWFTKELEAERLHDMATDPDQYPHTWEGEYELVTIGAYYTQEMLKVDSEGRIGDFPPVPGLPVKTAWDIGVDDYTAVWHFQEVSKTKVLVIGYDEFEDLGADHITYEAIDRRKERGWVYDRHYLPHDIRVREWGGGAKTREQTLRELGVSPIHRGAQQGPVERINASRRLLSICHFNQTEDVMQGVKRLRRYKKKVNQQTGQYVGPLKDGNDHGADAFGEYAVNSPITPRHQKPKTQPKRNDYVPARAASSENSWL